MKKFLILLTIFIIGKSNLVVAQNDTLNISNLQSQVSKWLIRSYDGRFEYAFESYGCTILRFLIKVEIDTTEKKYSIDISDNSIPDLKRVVEAKKYKIIQQISTFSVKDFPFKSIIIPVEFVGITKKNTTDCPNYYEQYIGHDKSYYSFSNQLLAGSFMFAEPIIINPGRLLNFRDN